MAKPPGSKKTQVCTVKVHDVVGAELPGEAHEARDTVHLNPRTSEVGDVLLAGVANEQSHIVASASLGGEEDPEHGTHASADHVGHVRD
jgi:hypothetical protein